MIDERSTKVRMTKARMTKARMAKAGIIERMESDGSTCHQ